MAEPEFRFFADKHSDRPMAHRVYAGDCCIGFVWRAWPSNEPPKWVTRLTPDGPDLTIEPTKRAAAQVLWRLASMPDEAAEQRELVTA